MDLKIDQETLRPLVQKIVLDSLTPEAKDQLLGKAIASLFQTSDGAYGRPRTSPLEDIFRDETQKVARQAVLTELEKPENKQRIADAVSAAHAKVWGDAGRVEKIIDRMVDALSAAMVEKEYR